MASKLDYGCIVYGSACGSYLRMLDPIQNHALRLCLGAYRTSPASSLCVEANVWSCCVQDCAVIKSAESQNFTQHAATCFSGHVKFVFGTEWTFNFYSNIGDNNVDW